MKQASSKLDPLNQISWQTFFVSQLAILFTYSQAFYERPPEGEETEKQCVLPKQRVGVATILDKINGKPS